MFKLLINVFANIVLLMYVPTLSYLADVAAHTTLATADLRMLRDPSPVLHSSLALLLLLVATVLGLYKPRRVDAVWATQATQAPERVLLINYLPGL